MRVLLGCSLTPDLPVRRRLLAVLVSAVGLFLACDAGRSTLPVVPEIGAPQSAAAAAPPAVEFYLSAHPDDWQLFEGNRTYTSSQTATKVVLVYVTAGDAGSKTNNPPYWQARETASKASVDSLGAGGSWSCGTQTLNSRSLLRCVKGKVVSYYMRLPDGNGEGQGYGYGSMARLRDNGQILTAIDNTASYSTWAALVTTIRALIDFESGGQSAPAVAVHAQDWVLEYNEGDHSDHMAVGELVHGASGGRIWDLNYYLGYPVIYQPVNLSPSVRAKKWNIFMGYDRVMENLMGESLVGTSHAEEWVDRTYWRSERSSGVVATPPVAPNPLVATAAGGTQINLTWTDAATDEDGYRLERAPDVSGAPGTFAQIASLAANTSSYNNTGLTRGVRYWYRVYGFNGEGNGAYTNLADATTVAIPVAPSATQAQPVSTTRIDVTWIDNSNNETTFRVERANDNGGNPGSFSQIASVGINITTYSNTGLTNGTRYWYRVRANNVAGYSTYSPNISAVAGATALPVAPSNLQAAAINSTRIDLTWTDNATNETGFRVERAPDVAGVAGTFAQVATAGANVTAYSNTGLTAGTRYWYRVVAYNGTGSSANSSQASATTPVAPAAPAAPTALLAVAASTSAIDLTWADNAANEDGYNVERAPDVAGAAGTFAQIASVAANATTYSNTGLTDGTRYWYRVVAYNAVGPSAYSNTASATTPVIPTAPAPPTTLQAVAASTSAIDLTWADNSANEDGFRVERAPDVAGAAGTFAQIASLAASATAYSNTGLTDGTRYWYRVVAYNAVGPSAYSNNASATTPVIPTAPAAPTTLQAVAASTSAINLTWADNSANEDGFRVERAPDVAGAAGTFAQIASLASNTTAYNNTGLSAGTRYWYRVVAYNAVGPSGYSNTTSATTNAGSAPIAPTNLGADAVGNTTIDLNWADDPNDETGYHVERAPDVAGAAGTFALIATLPANSIWYSNQGLSAGTYWYRVRAFNVFGPSGYTNLVSATALGAPTAPSAPGTLQAVAAGYSAIDLAWADNSANEDGFRVERAPDVAGAAGTFAQIATLPINATSYSNTGLTDGTRYWYRVVAYNAVGPSGYSNTANATTPVIPRAPTAPTTLQAVAANASTINLAWVDNSADEDGFHIEQAPDVAGAAGTYAQIATVAANTTSYSSTGLTEATRYWYRVVAYNAVGPSGYSNTASATTPATPTAPTAPGTLQAVAAGTAAIDLTWTDNSANEDGFHVERAPDVAGAAGTFAEIATVAANTTSYDNTGLVDGTSYWYRVVAYNAVGASAYSNTTSATTPLAPPAAPGALQVTAASFTSIDLVWVDNSSTEDGFRVERAPDVAGAAGTFAEIASLSANATSYNDTGLTDGTRYWYRVVAFNAAGPSGYSNSASTTTPVIPIAPSAPSTLQAVAAGTSAINLTWADNSGNEDGFRVERAPDEAGAAGTFAEIATVAANSTWYGNTGLVDGTRYWYRVIAYNAVGPSDYSNPTSAATPLAPPAAPGTLLATAASFTSVDLVWVDNSSTEDGYRVERAPDVAGAAGTFAEIASLSANAMSYNNTGLTDGTRYWYRVVAFNAAGPSGYSNSASATTPVIPTAPAAPATLQATAVSTSAIDLTWADNSVDEDGFHVERAPDVEGAVGSFMPIATLAANATSYSNTGLTDGTRYWYRVVAYNAVGPSGYSNTSSAMTPPPLPAAPGTLQAVAASGSAIDLTWVDNSINEDGFRVEQAPDVAGAAGAFAEIATVAANATSYSSTALTDGTRYWYRVVAYNAVGLSGYSNTTSATTPVIPRAPTAPATLTAVASGNSVINLAWADNSANEDGFRVERAPTVGGVAGTFVQIATVASNATSYSNTGLSAGTRYWYRVQAYNAVGGSAYSNVANATTVSGSVPIAPTNLEADVYHTDAIDLNWADDPTNETGYHLERAPDVGGAPGTFTLILTLPANSTWYSDDNNGVGLSAGTYWYRVRAFNAAGPSAYAPMKSATLVGPPVAPTSLQGTAVSSVLADLTWTDNSTDESGFRIQRAPDVGGVPGTFVTLATVGVGVTTYRANSMTASTKYWFRVQSYNAVGNSAYSNNATVTTTAYVAPSALTGTAYVVGSTRNVDLSWTRGSEVTVDIWRGSTRIATARVNDGGVYNNKPSVSLGDTLTYQVCAAGRTGTANCSTAVVNF